VHSLTRNAANCAPSDSGQRFYQVPRRRVSMKSARDLSDALRKVRRSSGHGSSDIAGLGHLGYVPYFGECPRDLSGFSYDRQNLACCHTYQRQEVFGRFIFGLGLEGELTQVFHHGVGINLADGTEFFL
jgi:hypothetical protein